MNLYPAIEVLQKKIEENNFIIQECRDELTRINEYQFPLIKEGINRKLIKDMESDIDVYKKACQLLSEVT